MKTSIRFIIILLLVSTKNYAQITIPAIKANFGVDADLRANYFNGLVAAGNDDWFNNGTAGTGQFIIDTSGAASIVAGYASNPATRSMTFSRLMKQTPYSVVNNRLLLDGIFTRDYHGDDSTVFAAGSNKNGMHPSSWSCPVSQGIPDKNDILDAMVHARRAGPNIMDSLWMFGGISIENTTGNRYFDFELYQTDFYYDRTTRTFKNYGPDDGHTAWLFNPDGSIQRPGDIIFTAEYGNSSLTLVEARIWVNQSSLALTPMFFNWGGLFDGASSSSVYGYANILPKTAGAFYTGLQSGNGVWPGPFNLVLQNNSVVTSYVARQYMEFSVNLTKLGLDPAYISTNGCGTPFRRVLIKTRASTSFSAELKDFIAPFRMFDYPYPQAVANIPIFFCEIAVSNIWVTNPMANSIYNWSTTNGRIVGPTTGTSITVDTAGSYIVNQHLHVQCPAFAADTVLILFDTLCIILDRNLESFGAVLNRNDVSLNWRVNHNEQISSFAVEYSMDNNNFLLHEYVESLNESGPMTYMLHHDVSNIHSAMIYYRLRLKGKDNRVAYSNIAAIRLNSDTKPGLLIYPNPSSASGCVWASLQANRTLVAEYNITDVNGKMIARRKIVLSAGTNTINLSDFENFRPGIYFIKMLAEGQTFTSKIMITD
jgi:hypothetical protein